MSTSILGSLAHADPEKAKKQILAALTKTKGDRSAAAAELEVAHRNLYRIIDRLGMWPEIDALMEAKGFETKEGPPRKADRPRARRPRTATTP